MSPRLSRTVSILGMFWGLIVAGPLSASADPGGIRGPEPPDSSEPQATAPAGSPTAADSKPVVAGEDISLFDAGLRTVWWSVPIAVLLTAGAAAQLRRARRHRLGQPGEQLAVPLATAAATEVAAGAVAAGRLRRARLRTSLLTVTSHAVELHDPPPVRAVQLDADRIEVLFANPAPLPPPGWSTVDGGHSWVRRVDDELTTPIRQLVTPALVTIGRPPSGGELLLDLETAGSLQLAGDRTVALGVARSMAVELATCPLGVAIEVFLVGIDVDGAEHCNRIWSRTSAAHAVRIAREALQRTATTGATSLVVPRAETDDDDEGPLDPQILIVNTAALSDADRPLVDELIGLCQSHTGVAVIVVGETATVCGEGLAVESSAQARWSGLELIPPIVGRETATELAVTSDHAANAATEPAATPPAVADLLDDTLAVAGDPSPLGNGHARADAAVGSNGDAPDGVAYVPPDYDVLVQVFDEVTVHGRGIIGAGDVELLTLLTCLRDTRPNIDLLATLLGEHAGNGGRSSSHRTVQARVSKLRAKLGDGANGEPLLPSAVVGRGSMGRYQVSARVLTDFELLKHRSEASQELASHDALVVLRDGLGLFGGPPFRARRGYGWAWPEGVAMRVHGIVIEYATRLMELAFDVDDLALVLQTVGCAGRVIDDPLTERPFRDLAREYAEASSDPDLAAAVSVAHQRLRDYVDDVDRVAPAD